jgi:hypothetical protein
LQLTVGFCRSLANGLFVFRSCFSFKSALLVHYSFGYFEGETFESYVLELIHHAFVNLLRGALCGVPRGALGFIELCHPLTAGCVWKPIV